MFLSYKSQPPKFPCDYSQSNYIIRRPSMHKNNISEHSVTNQRQTRLHSQANPICHHVNQLDNCKIYILRALTQVSATRLLSSKLVISYLKTFNKRLQVRFRRFLSKAKLHRTQFLRLNPKCTEQLAISVQWTALMCTFMLHNYKSQPSIFQISM